MKTSLSVIIITHNEEADLPACLESVKDLNAEIIVLDNASQDRTTEIARKFTPHVHNRIFDNFAGQKQAALDLATGQWVLSIDADERVSPNLRSEILERLGQNPAVVPDIDTSFVWDVPNERSSDVRDEAGGRASPGPSGIALGPGDPVAGFEIPYEVYFWGRRLRFGGLGNERHVRLFKRAQGRFSRELHEGIEVSGPVDRLRGTIQHHPYRDLDEYFAKMTVYTTTAAKLRHAQGKRFTSLHHLLPFWEFFVRVIVRLGILDGTPGIVWAGLSSFHTWIKYLKLKELSLQHD